MCIRDRDYSSGVARIAEAIVVALGVASGCLLYTSMGCSTQGGGAAQAETNQEAAGDDTKAAAGEDGEFLIFTVEDTGNGMDPESLAKLQKRINSEQTARCDERGFGMWNVNQRIKMCYGETCGIEVESEENRGMKVTLRVLKY